MTPQEKATTTKEWTRLDLSAKMYRAEAQYQRLRAEHAKEIGDTEAAEKARNLAEHAERVADREREKADNEFAEATRKWQAEALTTALKVKVRDYMMIADIPSLAANIPADLTFAHLADKTSLEAARREISHYEAAEYVADALDENYLHDSDAREKIQRAIQNLIEQANQLEDGPLTAYEAA